MNKSSSCSPVNFICTLGTAGIIGGIIGFACVLFSEGFATVTLPRWALGSWCAGLSGLVLVPAAAARLGRWSALRPMLPLLFPTAVVSTGHMVMRGLVQRTLERTLEDRDGVSLVLSQHLGAFVPIMLALTPACMTLAMTLMLVTDGCGRESPTADAGATTHDRPT